MSSRVLAIDPGTKRVGLAISDPSGKIALPLSVLESDGTLIAKIRELVVEQQVGEVIVGHPIALDGSKTRSSEEAETLARRLGARLEVPVKLYDERLSSVSARSAMRSGGASSREMRGKVDKVAAAMILQAYLDSDRL